MKGAQRFRFFFFRFDPSHRGGDAARQPFYVARSAPTVMGFNPLLIGEAAPPLLIDLLIGAVLAFQSPSHRGGGAARSLRQPNNSARDGVQCFNPLLIGEAAPPVNTYPNLVRIFGSKFQSPSHRGGGAADCPAGVSSARRRCRTVSIPFSSGRRRRLTPLS